MWQTPTSCPECGAPSTRGSRYCAAHKLDNSEITARKMYDAHSRDPWHRWYSMALWRRLRMWFLRQHPICEAPGCTTPANEVDHRIPHKGVWAMFVDPKNLQALCKHHHSQKTAKESSFAGPARTVTAP